MSRVLSAAALALLLSAPLLSAPLPALAKTGEETGDASEKPVDTQSLAGSYLAARVALTDRDTSNAVRHYRRALALDPTNVKLRQDAFLTLITNGDFAEAIEIGKTLPKDAAPGVVRLATAVDRLRAKDTAGAVKELDRNWTGALDRLISGLVLAWAQQGTGDTDLALDTIDGLRGPAWFDLFVSYHGGLIALAADRNEDAVKRLTRAVGSDALRGTPKSAPQIVEALAIAHARLGQFDEALEAVEKETVRQPGPLTDRLNMRLREKAVPAFPITSAQRGAAEVLRNIGSAIGRQGGYQFAGIYFQLANALAPKMDTVALALAEYYDQSGALERANAAFEAIPETSPYRRIARLEKALNLDELEKLDEARAALDKLLAEDPDDLVTTLSYGAVLARHEKFGDAAEIYEKALARIDDPQAIHWSLFYRQGIAYERTKRWPLAEAAFKKALELFPNEPRVLNYLGYSWVDMNMNLEEGLEMIETAVSLRPRDGYIVDSLGWALYRMGRYEDAVRELERAVELRPADPTINDHLGDALWRAGRKLEAVYQWNHALALDPEADQEQIIRDKVRNGLAPDIKDVAQPTAEPKDEAADDKS